MMMEEYIISIDQSTQGTKALLFNHEGKLLKRTDIPHKQIISKAGWISHDPEEIYSNTIYVVKKLIEESGIDRKKVIGIGISNQRETSLAWHRKTGKPFGHAIVWQCARAHDICLEIEAANKGDMVREHTGMPLSPYFPASKYAWILKNIPEAKKEMEKGNLCFGTVDSWLIFRLTAGRFHKTDFSNASRTQLFDIFDLQWDSELCDLFGISIDAMPQACSSNDKFGQTDLEGCLPHPIPIHGVLGDSHGALFGQGCLEKGMIKTTYGTGSSIMMNIGEKPFLSEHGIVTSLAWGIDGKINYVLEGNLNYTGAVITWLKEDLGLIDSAAETEALADKAIKADGLYLVPAFTGLGAPYWNSHATAMITGMTRNTGKNEIVRGGLECIAYQICDIIQAMYQDTGILPEGLRVDGGPTRNKYIMQFQSDILGMPVLVSGMEELSGTGAAWMAGMAMGLFGKNVYNNVKRIRYQPHMVEAVRKEKYDGWKRAVYTSLKQTEIPIGFESLLGNKLDDRRTRGLLEKSNTL